MSRGFSLIEVMVSLALGALVLAGAFGLHLTFNRQSQRQERIAEMQQTLRVARQVMERSLRGAGSGMEGGALQVNQCAGLPITYYAVQFSNSNLYVTPKVTFDNNAGDTDNDPDWVQVVAADPMTAVGATDTNGVNTVVNDVTQFNLNDLFIVVDVANKRDCVYQVTGFDNSGGNRCANCGALQRNPGQSCVNVTPNLDPCANLKGAPVRKLSGTVATFRVDKTNPATPRLTASFTPIGQPAQFQTIAENIEDLQVALVMNDGRVCGQAGYSVDDPALCDPTKARAVRFTLTARGSVAEQGVPASTLGGVEDEPATVMGDGYLRRTVTAEVQLRNLY